MHQLNDRYDGMFDVRHRPRRLGFGTSMAVQGNTTRETRHSTGLFQRPLFSLSVQTFLPCRVWALCFLFTSANSWASH